jgi:hypothetical protein
LICPFKWEYTCIPIIPRSHDSLIHAIFPFIIGICLDTTNRQIITDNDVIVIDLEDNSIDVMNQTLELSDIIPSDEYHELLLNLNRCVKNVFNPQSEDISQIDSAETSKSVQNINKQCNNTVKYFRPMLSVPYTSSKDLVALDQSQL